MLKKLTALFAISVLLFSCGIPSIIEGTVDEVAFQNNLELLITDGQARAITTDEFEITSLDIVVTEQNGPVVAAETWTPTVGYVPLYITISAPGFYTISVTHHGVNGSELISLEESASIRIKSMIITRVRITPGSVGISDMFDSSLIASYSFAGNADDSSIYGNDGIVNGPSLTTDRDGNADSAYLFTGGGNIPTGDFIDCGKTDSITSIDTEITITAWIKPDALGKSIMGRHGNRGQGGWTLAVANDGYYYFTFSTGTTGYRVDSTVAATVGQYNYVACVYSKLTGQFTISVDGVEAVGTSFTDGVFNYTDAEWPQCEHLEIGRYWASGWSYFVGVIDEVSFYDKALSATQIDSIK